MHQCKGIVVMGAAYAVHVPPNRRAINLELLSHLPESITLLELVYEISAISKDDQVVIDTVITMLARGRVRLRGTFRDCKISEFSN